MTVVMQQYPKPPSGLPEPWCNLLGNWYLDDEGRWWYARGGDKPKLVGVTG